MCSLKCEPLHLGSLCSLNRCGISRRLISWLEAPSCVTPPCYTDVKPHMMIQNPKLCQTSRREEEAAETHGHITSLAVARTHRKLGLATKLMQSARKLLLLLLLFSTLAVLFHCAMLCWSHLDALMLSWLSVQIREWQKCLMLCMHPCTCASATRAPSTSTRGRWAMSASLFTCL